MGARAGSTGRHGRGQGRGRGDHGVVLLMTSLLMVPLLMFVAFGVDVARWHHRIGELQAAADGAALAGTVWMPNLVKARAVATDALARNGVVHGQDDVTVTIEEGATPNSIRVTLTDHDPDQTLAGLVPTPGSLSRRAEAEYYLPLPLGSPLNYFGGDATKTALADTTTITVGWPNPYSSLSRPPTGPFGCNVGTTSAQGLGRWASATSYSATGFSGTAQCTWAPVTATTSPSPATQIPTNVPCNRLQSPSGSLGRWNSGVLGALPTYTAGSRFTSGTGNRQCSWSVAGTEPPDAATRAPTNAPCNVTGDALGGSWNLVVVPIYLPLALLAAPACQWLPSITTTVTAHPNPIAADRSPGFWAQVEGPGTVAAYGDAFSTLCTTALSCLAPESAQWRSSGYWYVVQAPDSSPTPITISVFDAAFRRSGVISAQTGDYNLGVASTVTNPDFLTEYRVYEQTNPLDVTARIPVGTANQPNQADNSCWWAVAGGVAFDLQWRPLCTVSPQAGTRYLVNVRTYDSGLAHGAGLNGYALQAVATGPVQPRLYSHADMGMFNNGSGTFYLAEVGPHFAGKVLAIDLWDPGDVASGTGTIYPKMPSLTQPRPVRDAPATCTYTASPEPNAPHTTTGAWGSTGATVTTPHASDSATRCAINTAPTGTAQRFNDEWLHIRIQIPSDYTCTPGRNPETSPGSCWWGIEHAFSSQPYDVTTWKARIEGNPVHLTG
jgi:hypothetical protein